MPETEDLIGDAWDALHETDVMRCCWCPACNFYLPEGEYKPGTECVTVTAIKRLIDAHLVVTRREEESASSEWDDAFCRDCGWLPCACPTPDQQVVVP